MLKFDLLEIIERKSDIDNMPLQDPMSVTGFYANIRKIALFDCLKYLPEIDSFYETTHSLLAIVSPLAFVFMCFCVFVNVSY